MNTNHSDRTTHPQPETGGAQRTPDRTRSQGSPTETILRLSRRPWANGLRLSLIAAVFTALALTGRAAGTGVACGSINNFDTVNDHGEPCHGFEIELDDLQSTDISYTYNWNYYGTPTIIEDTTSVPGHTNVIVRYASAKNADGTWAAYTAVPAGPIAPTDGHQFTNPAVNFGGEHFGVGYLRPPSSVKTINAVEVDLSTVVIVGDYIGAQMSALDVDAPLGLIDHLEDGEVNAPYTKRTVVIAGNAPFTATTSGALPEGMSFDAKTGVVSGTPMVSGVFPSPSRPPTQTTPRSRRLTPSP